MEFKTPAILLLIALCSTALHPVQSQGGLFSIFSPFGSSINNCTREPDSCKENMRCRMGCPEQSGIVLFSRQCDRDEYKCLPRSNIGTRCNNHNDCYLRVMEDDQFCDGVNACGCYVRSTSSIFGPRKVCSCKDISGSDFYPPEITDAILNDPAFIGYNHLRLSNCDTHNLGDSCTENRNCFIDALVGLPCNGYYCGCYNGICACNSDDGYVKDDKDKTCLATRGAVCSTSGVGCFDTFAECKDESCVCKEGYEYIGDICTQKVVSVATLGQTCDVHADCTADNLAPDARCNGIFPCGCFHPPNDPRGTCLCTNNYEQVGGECLAGFGTLCNQLYRCYDPNSECRSPENSCQCVDGYVYNPIREECQEAFTPPGETPNLGDPCTADSECFVLNYGVTCSGTGSECGCNMDNPQNAYCDCADGYVIDSTNLLCLAEVGSSCSVSVPCQDGNAKCGDTDVCECILGYTRGLSNQCVFISSPLQNDCEVTENCYIGNPLFGSQGNNQCTGTQCYCEAEAGVCTCSEGYEPAPLSNLCLPRIGQRCLSTADCYGDNVLCVLNVCRCTALHVEWLVGSEVVCLSDNGGPCGGPEDCRGNLVCQAGTCGCPLFQTFDQDDGCVPVQLVFPNLGAVCTVDEDCSISGLFPDGENCGDSDICGCIFQPQESLSRCACAPGYVAGQGATRNSCLADIDVPCFFDDDCLGSLVCNQFRNCACPASQQYLGNGVCEPPVVTLQPNLGDQCTVNSDCIISNILAAPGLTCDNVPGLCLCDTTCQCGPGFEPGVMGEISEHYCFALVGSSCTSPLAACRDETTMYCTDNLFCACRPGFTLRGRDCILIDSILGEPCDITPNCQILNQVYPTVDGRCGGTQCLCDLIQNPPECSCGEGFEEGPGNTCLALVGSRCAATIDCSDDNNVCTGTTCNCIPGYIPVTENGRTVCRADNGEPCGTSVDCARDLVCDAASQCSCPFLSAYDVDGNCIPDGFQAPNLDGICSVASDCTITSLYPDRLTCDDRSDLCGCELREGTKRCVCASGYIQSRPNECLPDENTACLDGQCAGDLVCTNLECLCPSNQLYNGNGVCVPEGELSPNLGMICAADNECTITNIFVINEMSCGEVSGYCHCDGTCTCSPGYVQGSGSDLHTCFAEVGSICLSAQCNDINSKCLQDPINANRFNCQCDNGYRRTASDTCEKLAADIGDLCDLADNCHVANPIFSTSSTCTGNQCFCDLNSDPRTCKCAGGYEEGPNNVCLARLGYTCDVTADCYDGGSTCILNTCECSGPYVQDSLNGEKLCRLAEGAPCTLNEQCAGDFQCTNLECHCPGTDVLYREPGICIPDEMPPVQPNLGSQCNLPEDCYVSNSFPLSCAFVPDLCGCTAGLCSCNTGYTGSSNLCLAEQESPCDMTTPCLDSNAICHAIDFVCGCRPGFEFDAQLGRCIQMATTEEPNLGSQCTLNGDCIVGNYDVTCTGTTCGCFSQVCNCGPDYQVSNQQCVAYADSDCSLSIPCVDNAHCVSGTCQCVPGYEISQPPGPSTCVLSALNLGEGFCDLNANCVTANALCGFGNLCDCDYGNGFVRISGECRAGFDTQCSFTSDCGEPNTGCFPVPGTAFTTCQCQQGYIREQRITGPVCLPGFGLDCSSECAGDLECDAGGVFTPSCACPPLYRHAGNAVCEIVYGSQCLTSNDCQDQENTACVQGVCDCAPNYGPVETDGNTICLPVLGVLCTDTDGCFGADVVCTGSTCQCSGDLVPEGGIGGTCEIAAGSMGLGGPCTLDSDCAVTLASGPHECDGEFCYCHTRRSPFNTCECTEGYDQLDGTCKTPVYRLCDLDGTRAECSDDHASCTLLPFIPIYTCTCDNGYTYNQQTGVCELAMSVIGDNCLLTSECTSVNPVPGTPCTTSGLCACSQGQCTCNPPLIPDNNECKAVLNGNCGQSPVNCYGDNVICSVLSDTCTCRPNHFPDDGMNCLPGFNEGCTAVSGCTSSQAGLFCNTLTGRCSCPHGNGFNVNINACEPVQGALGAACVGDEYCLANGATCSTIDACSCTGSPGICSCSAGYAQNGLNCLASIGDSCTASSFCLSGGVTCDSNPSCFCDIAPQQLQGTCQCRNGYSDDVNDGNCQPAFVSIGEFCVDTQYCVSDGVVCDGSICLCDAGTCRCQPGYVPSGGNCVEAEAMLGEQCTGPEQCLVNGQTCADIAACECDGICRCTAGYTETLSNTCVGTINLACAGNEYCSAGGSLCSNNLGNCECSGLGVGEGVCSCKPGYAHDVNAGSCVPAQVTLGETCVGSIYCTVGGVNCAETNVCDCGTGVCSCSLGFVVQGAVCVHNTVSIGASCGASVFCESGGNLCIDTAGVCSCNAGQCSCGNGFVQGGNECFAEIGFPCTYAVCDDQNSFCNGNDICECTTGYVPVNGNCEIDPLNIGQSGCQGDEFCFTVDDVACDTTSVCECNLGTDICECSSGYTNDGTGSCDADVSSACVVTGVGGPTQLDCSDGNAQCSQGTCSCNPDYTYNSIACVSSNPGLGEFCEPFQGVGECSGDNVECVDNECVCSTEFVNSCGECLAGTLGTEFVFTCHENALPVDSCLLLMARPDDVAFSVTITSFAEAAQTVQFGLNAPAVYLVGNNTQIVPGIDNDVITLTSSIPISLFLLAYGPGSTDAHVVYPNRLLGDVYYVINFLDTQPGLGSAHSPYFTVLATEDNTVVTIERDQLTTEETLQSHQSYSIQNGTDYTGTKISATKNVAVVVGHTCGFITDQTTLIFCDKIMTQMMGVSLWKTTFAVNGFYPLDRYRLKVLAQASNTRVQVFARGITGPIQVLHDTFLQAGESMDFYVPESQTAAVTAVGQLSPVIIQADRPIQVVQVAMRTRGAVGKGDPASVIVPGCSQWLSEYHFVRPFDDGHTDVWASIVITCNYVNFVTVNNNIPQTADVIQSSTPPHMNNACNALPLCGMAVRLPVGESHLYAKGQCFKAHITGVLKNISAAYAVAAGLSSGP